MDLGVARHARRGDPGDVPSGPAAFRRLRSALNDLQAEGEEESGDLESVLSSLPVVLMAVVGIGGTVVLLWLKCSSRSAAAGRSFPRSWLRRLRVRPSPWPRRARRPPSPRVQQRPPGPREPRRSRAGASRSRTSSHNLSHGLTQSTHVRRGAAVASPNLPGVFLISADVQGRGLKGSTDIATRATDGLERWTWIVAVDDAARRFSGFPDAALDQAAPGATAVEDSRACARSLLGVEVAAAPGATANAAKTPRVQPPELVAHHGSTTLEGTDERDRL